VVTQMMQSSPGPQMTQMTLIGQMAFVSHRRFRLPSAELRIR
jgi:hypothetical protein